MPDDLTNTDKKIIFSDHDILVELRTTMNIMLRQQTDFYKTYDEKHSALVSRVTTLEINQAAHRQETKDNAADIETLQRKSNQFDILNAIGTAITGILAGWFGSSR